MVISDVLAQIKGGLVVSCQALADEPLFGAHVMAAMACAAVQGGAVAIRANSPDDIAAIRRVVDVPIIGLYKENIEGYPVYITPTLRHAKAIADAGADLVALDATARLRPGEQDAGVFLRRVKDATQKPVVADVSVYEEGVAAWQAGADAVATTLAGYTEYGAHLQGPDFDLLKRLALDLPIPVIAEGRIATSEQAARALDLGAFAVVVGGAITRPQWITRQFVNGISSRNII